MADSLTIHVRTEDIPLDIRTAALREAAATGRILRITYLAPRGWGYNDLSAPQPEPERRVVAIVYPFPEVSNG